MTSSCSKARVGGGRAKAGGRRLRRAEAGGRRLKTRAERKRWRRRIGCVARHGRRKPTEPTVPPRHRRW